MLMMQLTQKRGVGEGKGMATYEITSPEGLPLFRIYVEWIQGESALWRKGESRFGVNLYYVDALRNYAVDEGTAWVAARRAFETTFVTRTKVLKEGNGYSCGSHSLKSFFLCAKEDSFKDDLERWVKALVANFDMFLTSPQDPLFVAHNPTAPSLPS